MHKLCKLNKTKKNEYKNSFTSLPWEFLREQLNQVLATSNIKKVGKYKILIKLNAKKKL
jgi:hypothetical protein